MTRTAILGLVAGVGVAASLAAADDKDGKAPPATPPTPPTPTAQTPAAPGGAVDLKAPLPTDERLVTGTLPNGLSYIVLKHPNPPGRANMYIHVSSGSLNEKDNQRGIAHYLEHMAFNGSENFPPNTVVDFFQSMGLTFGQHQNAFTSFDQTTYILAFPDVKPDTLERGMRFFSDVAFRLGLTQKEIDSERQIIFEEKRTREGGGQRMQDYVLERLIPGSLIGVRLPIGTADTLKGVNRPDFLDYYNHWYVPSNMTVVVVADADPKVIVDQIAKSFSGGEKKPRPVDQDVNVKPYTGTRAIVASDKEQTKAEIEIVSVGPKMPPVQTVGTLREQLVRQLGTQAFNRRIGAKIAKGGTSYLDGGANAINLFNAAMIKQVSVDGKPENWKAMMKEMGEEVQRARLHGFTAREIDDVKSQMLSQAEQYVEQERTLPGGRVIGAINQDIASENTIMGAKQELELYKRLLPSIAPEEVSKTFANIFETRNVTFVAQLPSEMPGGLPTEQDLIAAGRAALDATPTAETESDRPTVLMAAKPAPGKLADVTPHEASKVVSAWLDNGIRVHYRFMDIRKEQVSVHINLAAGQIQETADNRGVAEAAGLAWSEPATSTLTSTNIRDLMTGKKIRVGSGGGPIGGLNPDIMSLTVSGSPADLETGMQLANLLLTDPVVETAAFDRWKTQQTQFIAMRKNVVDVAMLEALFATVYPPSEARTQLLTSEQVDRLSAGAAQKWLRSTIAAAPIEVTVVGDIPQERAMELVSTYLGSLPKRERISPQSLAGVRTMKRPAGPTTRTREVPTETNKSIVVNGFYGADAKDLTDTRLLNAASRIVSTRMLKKVREEEQLAYSPSARNQPGEAYPGFGLFMFNASTEPGKVERLVQATTEIYKDFASGGPTPEEMETYKKQIANTLDEQMKDPGFWTGRTGTLSYRGVSLDDVVNAPEFYQSVTADQIKGAFAKYYKPESVVQLVVKPAAGAKTDAKPAEKTSMTPTP